MAQPTSVVQRSDSPRTTPLPTNNQKSNTKVSQKNAVRPPKDSNLRQNITPKFSQTSAQLSNLLEKASRSPLPMLGSVIAMGKAATMSTAAKQGMGFKALKFAGKNPVATLGATALIAGGAHLWKMSQQNPSAASPAGPSKPQQNPSSTFRPGIDQVPQQFMKTTVAPTEEDWKNYDREVKATAAVAKDANKRIADSAESDRINYEAGKTPPSAPAK